MKHIDMISSRIFYNSNPYSLSLVPMDCAFMRTAHPVWGSGIRAQNTRGHIVLKCVGGCLFKYNTMS